MMNKNFWEARYAAQNLGWDIGRVSDPLKAYIDQLADKEQKILVPGAGYGHEVRYLFRSDFRNLYALDIAGQPLRQLQRELPEFPEERLLQGDFFDLEEYGFDLILEQTFFCALPPDQRPAYVRKMHALLAEKGRLAGLLFNFPLSEEGPPFGGSREEYVALFEPFFTLRTLERAYNSIPSRQGSELFFIFEKK